MANFDCLSTLKDRMAWIKNLGSKSVTLPTVTVSKSDIKTGNDIGDTRITGYTAPVFWRYQVSNSWSDAAWIASAPDFETITQMLQSAIKCRLSKDRALRIAGGFFAKDGSKDLSKLIVWARRIDSTSKHIEVWEERLKPKFKPPKNENFFDKYWRQYYQSKGFSATEAAGRVKVEREAIKTDSAPVIPIIQAKEVEVSSKWLYKVEREFEATIEELTAMAFRENKALYSENQNYKVRLIGRCLMLIKNDEIFNLTAAKLNLQRLSA